MVPAERRRGIGGGNPGRARARALALAVAAVAALAGIPAAAQNELRGEWASVSMTADGKAVELPERAVTLTIADDAWLEQRASGEDILSFTVNPNTNPKQIDLTAVGAPITLHGIYKVERDLLTVSLPIPLDGKVTSKRPASFDTKPGDPFAVFTYRRAGDPTALQALLWESDWKAAFAKAKEQNQLVFVDFFATWCGPCRMMEATVFRLPAIKKRLSDFVLLRLDVDRNRQIAAAHAVTAFPTYAVFDPGERQRFRFFGSRPAPAFRTTLDGMREYANAMLRVSDLMDRGKDIEGFMLLGNTYTALNMFDPARDAYRDARTRGEKAGDKRAMQLADALSAFTFAREGNPKRALNLLEKLTAAPADGDTAALLWLTTGHAQELANNRAAARAAYERVIDLGPAGSRVVAEARAAIDAMSPR